MLSHYIMLPAHGCTAPARPPARIPALTSMPTQTRTQLSVMPIWPRFASLRLACEEIAG